MKLVRWELNIGWFKVLLGMRHYYFIGKDEDVMEDVVFYLGVVQIVITLIRVKE